MAANLCSSRACCGRFKPSASSAPDLTSQISLHCLRSPCYINVPSYHGGRNEARTTCSAAVESKGFGSNLRPKTQLTPAAERTGCPCGSGKEYEACCGPLHKGEGTTAATAEDILRARFSAYVKKHRQFVVDTTHPDNPAMTGSSVGDTTATFEQDVQATMNLVAFSNLQVKQVSESDDSASAIVSCDYEFRQRKSVEGGKIRGAKLQKKSENSVFRKHEGVWKFVGPS